MKIYVFGHKKPDTDSVCASISLSYLKNKLGMNTEPRVLGTINNETKFVLDYFKFKEPVYLNDAKLQIRYINYNKNLLLNENVSIKQTFDILDENNVSGIPLVDNDNLLKGYVNYKEITKYIISNQNAEIHTSYENLLIDLNGTEITRYNEDIKGILSFSKGENSIFIISSEEQLKKALLQNPILIIYIDKKISENIINEAKNNKVNIIRSDKSFFEVMSIIKLSNYIHKVNIVKEPIKFFEKDYRDDLLETAKKYGHTNYPVVKKNNECLGMIRLLDQDKYEKQKVILVDHNQPGQSVDGLEEAKIIEIIDHHNIGLLGTNVPISIRSMPVGSTCTIIYQMFIEAKIQMPQNIAGLILSAIISDTLMLKSPTTTSLDIEIANIISKHLKIDMNEFAYKMFKNGSSIDNLNSKEIIMQDFKSYKTEEGKIGIGQTITMDFDEINQKQIEYIDILNKKVEDSDYKISLFFVTDILKNGSYLFYNDKASEIIKDAYNIKEIHQGIFIEEMVSRKKQMIPPLLEYLKTKN